MEPIQLIDKRSSGAYLDSLPMNRRHWMIFALCAAGFVFDALDFQIMALVAPAMAKQWNVRPTEMGYVLSATAVGMLLGSYLFGMISDRIGRRLSFQATIAIFAAFCGLSAFAQNIEQLAILRFLTGIGIGGLVPVDTAMMTEFMPKKNRGRLMALWAMFFPIGGLLAAFTARWVVPEFGWQGLFLVGVSPAILVLFVRRLIPESPRYLLERGRTAEATQGIQWLSLGHLPEELSNAPKSGAQALRERSPVEVPTASARLLFSPEYRRRTTMLWLVWFGWSFSYFGILLWLPSLLVDHRGFKPAEVFGFIVGFMLAGVSGRIFVSLFIDGLGRKPTLALCGAGATCMAIVFGHQTDAMSLAIWGYALAFFHDGGLSVIAPYTPELYPTRARATGVGYANGCGRIASIVSPIVVGYLTPMGLSTVFIVLSSGYAITVVVVLLFGIETKGLQLEDAALELPVAPEEHASRSSMQCSHAMTVETRKPQA